MKKITIMFFLLLCIVIKPSISNAEWEYIVKNIGGKKFYVENERIRKHSGYIYYWTLTDYLKSDRWGSLSAQTYHQGDCNLFRYKFLSFSFHKQPMGNGDGDYQKPVKDLEDWQYPPPKSVDEILLNYVCNK